MQTKLRYALSLSAETNGNANPLHGTSHRRWVVVVRVSMHWRVKVFIATGTGQKLPPVSFEFGSTGKGGAVRRCPGGYCRGIVGVVVVMVVC